MKTNFLIILILLGIFSSLSFAQAPDTLWTKTFGGSEIDEAYSVQQTSDGGFIIIGNTDSYGAGNSDLYLVRTNQSGDTLWTKTFGGSNKDIGMSVHPTSDGGYIITGSTYSFGNAFMDVWLIKTDAFGDTLWTKTFGGNNYDYGYSVQQTSDSGYIIAGGTASFGAGNYDVFLIRTDQYGDTLWTKTFGGTEYDIGICVQQTSDGGFIITGNTNSYGAGNIDVLFIRTNQYGDTLWAKTFGGTEDDYGNFVQQISSGGFVITGNTRSYGAGVSDIFLLRLTTNGNVLWAKTYGGINIDFGNSVQQTSDGGYIICGSTGSFGSGGYDAWLIRTLSNGDTVWTKTLGGTGSEKGNFARQTSDEGYIVTGYTTSFGSGGTDIWLVRLDADSNPTHTEIEQDFSPSAFQLFQNYPNPFNPTTKISWQSAVGSWQTLKIYDVLGKEVATLVDEYKPAGSYEVEFNAFGLTSGVYFYRLNAGIFSKTKKLLLTK